MSRGIHNAQNLSHFSIILWQVLTDNKIADKKDELTLSQVMEGTGKASAAHRST